MTTIVPVNGIEIAYETFGSPADPTVLLVMGLGTQMLAWPDEFCGQLADRGLHVVRFDNRDVGLSTHLHDAPTPNLAAAMAGDYSTAAYRLDDMAADTIGLLDALGIDAAHLVGASMGGMIAQTVAIRHPGRVRSLTSIMSTPGPAAGAPSPAARSALFMPPPRNRDEAAEAALRVFRIIGSPGYRRDEDALAELARRSFDRAHDPLGVSRQMVAILASGDRTAALSDVRVPTLVIHGTDDPLIGFDGGQATADAIPGATLLAFPGMGHDLPRPLWHPIIDALTEHIRRATATTPVDA